MPARATSKGAHIFELRFELFTRESLVIKIYENGISGLSDNKNHLQRFTLDLLSETVLAP